MTLTSEQQKELNQFYWETDISTGELQAYFGLKKGVHLIVSPLATNTECPNCKSRLVYRSRAKRTSDEKDCVNCGHIEGHLYRCQCAYCGKRREEQERHRKEIQRKRARELYEDKITQTGTPEYVSWALSKLSRREKIFLRSLLEIMNEDRQPTWAAICERAGVVSQKSYVDKLLTVNLLYPHPDGGLRTNPAVSLEMLEIKNVRNISKSLRFDVFQRDNHTCQYCGRKVPDVTLVVDHLLPVARGGTDEFENLVTSCDDCNGGKSAKLIERFTGGYTQDEWRERIRQKRVEVLKARRIQLDDVIAYWSECRGTRQVSDYDRAFIHTLIERYEPAWIKAAIAIASRHEPSNYGKYAAGILRNWAKNGPPQNVSDPDSQLRAKKATPKQVEYIQGLINNLGVQLADIYPKSDFTELTMLDAQNLINALTAEPIEDIQDVEEYSE